MFALFHYTSDIADRFGMHRVSCAALLAGAVVAQVWASMSPPAERISVLSSTLAVLQGIGLALDLLARKGLVSSLVARDNLFSAIPLDTTTLYMRAFVGQALFGLLVAFTVLYFVFYQCRVLCVVFLLPETAEADGA